MFMIQHKTAAVNTVRGKKIKTDEKVLLFFDNGCRFLTFATDLYYNGIIK
jgi:hypothetical protein